MKPTTAMTNAEYLSNRTARTQAFRLNTLRLPNRMTIVPAIVFGALFAAGPALAANGDVVRLGSLASPATFVDARTGTPYQLFFEAVEHVGGAGDTTIVLGNGPRACSVHGPEPEVDPGSDFSYPGNNPLVDVQCGTAYGQSVSINGCVVTAGAHGFMHSDHPKANYLGMTTIDVKFQRSATADKIQVTLYTPKEIVKLSGNLTAGTVSIPNCP